MANVYIDYRSISWGAPNEDDSNNVWALEDQGNDPNELVLADFGMVGTPVSGFPAPPLYPHAGVNYHFAFWNATTGTNAVPSYPNADPAGLLTIPDMPDSMTLHATAWYVGEGSGPPGPPVMRLRTFDIDLNGFRKETPIASANPAASWPGPNQHSVSTEAAGATATAKAALQYPAPVATQPPGEPPKNFKRWQVLWGALTAAPSPATMISCGAQVTGLALAFFGHGGGKQIGKPNVGGRAYDFWAEFWGRRGAEGTGPWGPGGPGGPWGPLIGRAANALSPAEQAQLQALLKKMPIGH